MKKRIFEKRLNRFLECYDYRFATFLGAYGVYKVYEPDRSHLGIYIGLPELVMVNGRNIFMVDGEESADILKYFNLKNGVACACDYCKKENCDDCDVREQRDACNNAETETELCHEQDATLTPDGKIIYADGRYDDYPSCCFYVSDRKNQTGKKRRRRSCRAARKLVYDFYLRAQLKQNFETALKQLHAQGARLEEFNYAGKYTVFRPLISADFASRLNYAPIIFTNMLKVRIPDIEEAKKYDRFFRARHKLNQR